MYLRHTHALILPHFFCAFLSIIIKVVNHVGSEKKYKNKQEYAYYDSDKAVVAFLMEVGFINLILFILLLAL